MPSQRGYAGGHIQVTFCWRTTFIVQMVIFDFVSHSTLGNLSTESKVNVKSSRFESEMASFDPFKMVLHGVFF